MSFAYATILDARYLPRGLALQMSVARHDPSALFAFYCMDDLAAALLGLLQLPRCRIYTEGDFAPGALRAVRPARSVAEYCWTAKPFILSHLLEAETGVDWVAYLKTSTCWPSATLAMPLSRRAMRISSCRRIALPRNLSISHRPSGPTMQDLRLFVTAR